MLSDPEKYRTMASNSIPVLTFQTESKSNSQSIR